MTFNEMLVALIRKLFVGYVDCIEYISDGSMIEIRFKEDTYARSYISLLYTDGSSAGDWSVIEYSATVNLGDNAGFEIHDFTYTYDSMPTSAQLEEHIKEFGEELNQKIERMKSLFGVTQAFYSPFNQL